MKRATVAAVAKAWRVLVRLVRMGLVRDLVVIGALVGAGIALVDRNYGAASVALLGLIWLELTDPRRPSRVIVLRQKRKASRPRRPSTLPARVPSRAQDAVPERSRYGGCRECGAPELEWCRDGCSLLDRWDYR